MAFNFLQGLGAYGQRAGVGGPGYGGGSPGYGYGHDFQSTPQTSGGYYTPPTYEMPTSYGTPPVPKPPMGDPRYPGMPPLPPGVRRSPVRQKAGNGAVPTPPWMDPLVQQQLMDQYNKMQSEQNRYNPLPPGHAGLRPPTGPGGAIDWQAIWRQVNMPKPGYQLY